MKRSRGYSQIRADVEIVGRLLGERGEGEEMLRRICQVGDIDPASAKIGCPLPLLKRWGYVSRIHLVQCVQMEDSGQVHESFGSKRHGTVLRSSSLDSILGSKLYYIFFIHPLDSFLNPIIIKIRRSG